MQDFSYCLTTYRKDLKNYYLSTQIWADNNPISLVLTSTCKAASSHDVDAAGESSATDAIGLDHVGLGSVGASGLVCIEWNEWIIFSIPYSSLPLSSCLAITVWACKGPRSHYPVGGSTFQLFGKNKTVKKANYRLKIWPGVVADGSLNTTTPSKVSGTAGELDRLEKLMRKYERGDIPKTDWLDALSFKEFARVKREWQSKHDIDSSLYIQLPIFDFPIVFNEKEYGYPDTIVMRQTNATLIKVWDPELFLENPVEARHRKLARSHRTGPLDRELKPNAKIRDELHDILRYPPTKPLTDQEKDLLWKFRFYLTRDKKALTKFLKCVIWSDPVESKQAIELLSLWVAIDVEDGLELLGPEFTDHAVRSFAVNQLKRAEDEELQLYLLQLVQALKFEKFDQRQDSSLVHFLIERGISNPILGNLLYWYLMVETEDKVYGKTFGKVVYRFLKVLVETSEGTNRRDNLRRQGELIATLSNLSREFRASKEPRPKKIERLRAYITDPKNGLLSFPPLALPLDPSIQVTGLVPEKAGMFKSQLQPLHLTFTCLDGSEYPIIFKTGDDLRQDQLIVQIITLMDKLLRKENLDLRITPYKVLATGVDHGMLQFVPSKAIASILSEFGNSLVPFLSHTPTTLDSPFQPIPATPASTPAVDNIGKLTMDTYLRSTAGYCVMTYLLGVGDRHLDNLLLTPQGNLFHVDFGFILGRDPKPFPPPMKLCKEMVEVMGGAQSSNYHQFRSYSFIAFNSLRKSANLILNLFSLMVKATIADITIEPEKTVTKVQERFQLHLTDEEAIHYFSGLINESIQAYFPQIVEQIHRVAQYFKTSEYDRGVNTFSPEGRLFQVEYAIEAIKVSTRTGTYPGLLAGLACGLGSTAIGIQTKEGVVLAVEKRVTSTLLEGSSIEKIVEIDSHLGCAMSGLIADSRTMIDHARIEAQKIKVESVAQSVCDLALRFGESADGEDALMSLTLTEATSLALKVLKAVIEEKINAGNVQVATITKDAGYKLLPESALVDLIAALP
ncbi:Phosphatidylinositol (PI) 3-kinase [Kappamyces sp. JEL0680]|nr:Phosphatidylinositol (PI) 3-kinase [Kappamyces sp. JEL0680]